MKTNSLFKRLVSMLIVVLMICTLFPVTALAEEYERKPGKPTDVALDLLLDVEIYCKDVDGGDTRTYLLLRNGTYTIGDVTGNEKDGYTCTVTINSDKYIQDYSATRSPGPIAHELAEGESPSKTVTLEYGSFGWRVKDSRSGTAEINFYVVHKKTYTLSYDANGGDNPPPPETKTVNVGQSATFTIPDTEPTRQGYEFKGWATTEDATTAAYQHENEIAINANTTLYAVWEKTPEKVKYKLTYNANGGKEDSVPDPQTAEVEDSSYEFIIPDNKPTRLGYSFLGWADAANATEANVEASYTLSSSDPSKTLYAVWKKDAPTYDELNKLFGNNAVKIHCTNTEAKHNPATYGLLPNSENKNDSYSIGEPQKDEKTGGYTCEVTVNSAKYIEEYNKTNAGHKALATDPSSKNITLEYTNGAWTVESGSAPVTFTVECVVWNNLSVHKDSTTTNGIVGTVIPGEEITYTITVKNETGKDLTDIEVSEVLNPNLTLKSISPENANYKNGVWTISSLGNGDTATLTIKVQVSREVADGTEIKNTATIRAAKYGTHSLPGDIRPTGSSDVKVKVPYTVTYTDGVADEEVFKDQVYSNLFSGDSTPAYNGGTNPTRYGYVFAGWYPTVEATVSGNATYKATWKEDINHNGIADEDEDKYTVRYTDGVYGVEIFKDEVYGGLLSGTRTPLFQGSLTRRGYVFTGWRPAVSGTVTGDATYIATWRKVKDTTVIEIGGGNSSSSSSKEENPNTGAPVFVGVSVGALAAAK